MLIYTLIFLVSVILAVVILVSYRTISESRSILNFKASVMPSQPIGGIGNRSTGSMSAKPQAASARSQPGGVQARQAASRNLAGSYPATPAGRINQGWEDCRSQVNERNQGHAGAVSVSRCSLYEVSSPGSTASNKGGIDWSFGEDALATGRTPRVKDQKARPKAARRDSGPETSAKPWGW